MVTGVYCWLNRVNGKRYVGSASVSILLRLRWYRERLPKGLCHNRHLQRAWNKYGGRRFVFMILERCAPEDCISREQHWMDHYRSYDLQLGYNICPVAGSNRGVKQPLSHRMKTSEALRRRVTKPETRAKRSASLMGHPVSDSVKKRLSEFRKGTTLSAETRAKISAAGKGRTPTVSPESRARMSAIAKARLPMSLETRAKISEIQKGRRHSEETRRKIAESGKLGWIKRKARTSGVSS